MNNVSPPLNWLHEKEREESRMILNRCATFVACYVRVEYVTPYSPEYSCNCHVHATRGRIASSTLGVRYSTTSKSRSRCMLKGMTGTKVRQMKLLRYTI